MASAAPLPAASSASPVADSRAAALRAQVLAGLVWSAVRNWGSRLISLLVFVVLARYVQPAEMGLVAAALAVIAFTEILTEQGVVSAIVQRRELTPGLLNAAFVLNLGIALVFTIVLVATAPQVATWMRMPELTDLLRAVSITLVFSALGFCQLAMFQRSFHYKGLALRTLAATALSGVAGLALVLQGYGAWGLAVQAILAVGLKTMLLWVRSPWRPSAELDFRGLADMTHYSLRIVGSRLLTYGNTRFVDLFLGATLGPVVLGVYAVGMRFYHALMQLLSGAVLEVAHGGFSRLAGDRPRLLAAYYDAGAASAMVALPLFALTGLLAPELCEVVFGARWLASAPVMVPMALFGAVQVVQFYNGSVLNAIGLPSKTLAVNVAKLVATVAALLATRGQPLLPIVWAFVAAQLCVTPLSYWMARRHAGVSLREHLRRVAPFVAGVLLMVAGGAALRRVDAVAALAPVVRGVLVGGAAAALYLAVAAAFARPQLSRLRELLRRRPPPT